MSIATYYMHLLFANISLLAASDIILYVIPILVCLILFFSLKIMFIKTPKLRKIIWKEFFNYWIIFSISKFVIMDKEISFYFKNLYGSGNVLSSLIKFSISESILEEGVLMVANLLRFCYWMVLRAISPDKLLKKL